MGKPVFGPADPYLEPPYFEEDREDPGNQQPPPPGWQPWYCREEP